MLLWSRKALAYFFDVSVQSVDRWVVSGCPCERFSTGRLRGFLVGGVIGWRERRTTNPQARGLLAEAVQRHCVDVMTNGSEALYRDKIVEYLRAGMELEEAFNAARIGSEITSAAIASYTRAPVGSHVPDDLELSFTTWRRDIWPKMGKHA